MTFRFVNKCRANIENNCARLQERLQNMERLLESTRDLEGEGYDGVTHLHGEGLPRRRTGRRTQTLGTALQPMGVNSHVAKVCGIRGHAILCNRSLCYCRPWMQSMLGPWLRARSCAQTL
jgi:hypothetical protein